MMMNLIAELSKGGLTPDGRALGAPQRILYQCSEDGAKDTIKPRLLAAEADCSKIAFIDEEVYDGLTLDDERIREAEAYKLARHYSEYRLLHEQQRRMNTTDGKILSLLERNNEEARSICKN